MTVVHHSAIHVSDVEASLRFWRDGIGLDVLMDERFEGDWPTLLRAPGTGLRAVFLGDASRPDSGIVELVDLGADPGAGDAPADAPPAGFLLLSVFCNLEATTARLTSIGVDCNRRRVRVSGIDMVVVQDPDGVSVELVDSGASANLERLRGQPRP